MTEKKGLSLRAINPGPRTLSERAISELHSAILSGRLEPGQRLTIERLAEQLGTSPMPVREALRQLAAVGLVENIPHRGARVTDLTLKDLTEVYEARLALEPLATRRAAERFTDEDAESASQRLAELDEATKAKDDDAIWTAHTGFHLAIYRAADSSWFERLIQPLWESSERYRRAAPARSTLRERRAEHKRILEACRAHEPEHAEAEMHNHLAKTANRLAGGMGAGELFPIS